MKTESGSFPKVHTYKELISNYSKEFDNEITIGSADIHFKIKGEFSGKNVSFLNCYFSISVDVEKISDQNIVFENCTFEEDVFISDNRDNETSFISSIFKNTFYSFCVVFKTSLILRNITFNGPVDLSHCHMERDFQIENVVSKHVIDFAGTKFHKKAGFYNLICEGPIIFNTATFEGGLNLCSTAFRGGLLLFDVKVWEFSSFKEEGRGQEEGDILGNFLHSEKRETYRILKYELERGGNIIDSLKYASKEKAAYAEELGSETYKFDIGNIGDRFIFFVNASVSSHGSSWPKAAAFTFLGGLLFFWWSLAVTDEFVLCGSFNEKAFGYFWDFLFPLHKRDYMGCLVKEPYGWFAVLDFFGRVVVGVGVFHLIKAFRKFR